MLKILATSAVAVCLSTGAAYASNSYFECADATGQFLFYEVDENVGEITILDEQRQVAASVLDRTALKSSSTSCTLDDGRVLSTFFELEVLKVSAKLFEDAEKPTELYIMCESGGDSYPNDEAGYTWEGDEPPCVVKTETHSGMIK